MIDPEHIPKTLEDAVAWIMKRFKDSDLQRILNTENVEFNSNFGMGMRNTWGLWFEVSPLRKHFQERFGLGHADDISSIISNAIWSKIHGVPYDPSDDVESFKRHWERYSCDPMTGETIKHDTPGKCLYCGVQTIVSEHDSPVDYRFYFRCVNESCRIVSRRYKSEQDAINASWKKAK